MSYMADDYAVSPSKYTFQAPSKPPYSGRIPFVFHRIRTTPQRIQLFRQCQNCVFSTFRLSNILTKCPFYNIKRR